MNSGSMDSYFRGAITQSIERAKLLLGKIPSDLPREFHALAATCQNKLDEVVHDLRFLLCDPQWQKADLQAIRLRRFRRVAEDLNVLEVFALSALQRVNEEDHRLNRLVDVIRTEIRYPLLPPTVTSLSQDYFHILLEMKLNLLFVPPIEADFLLHLPDLYHELGHPLLIEKNHPRVRPFQVACAQAASVAHNLLEQERVKEGRRHGDAAQRLIRCIIACQQSWMPSWATEFFCDLFAVYTLGPAFVWSHLHLCAKRGQNPFGMPQLLPTTHPPDEARMAVMLSGLNIIGFEEEAGAIEEKWNALIELFGTQPEPEYDRCFPKSLIFETAQIAYRGVEDMKCRIVSPNTQDKVFTTLNNAWHEFWIAPNNFAFWEKKAVDDIMAAV